MRGMLGLIYIEKKEMFVEARKRFMGLGASTSQNQVPIVSRKEKPEDTTATQD